MNDLFAQTVVEKLTSIDQTSKDQSTQMEIVKEELSFIKKGIASKPSQPLISEVKLDELSKDIKEFKNQLQIPINNRVEHKHHLHKAVWIAGGLFVVCFLLSWGWLSTYRDKQISQANDIKYRFQRIMINTAVAKLCDRTDSLYLKDSGRFRDSVEQEEQRLIEQANLIRLAGEKEGEAKALRDQAGRK